MPNFNFLSFSDRFRCVVELCYYSAQCLRIPERNVEVPIESVNLMSVEISERCQKLIVVEVDDKNDLVVMPNEVCAGVFQLQ